MDKIPSQKTLQEIINRLHNSYRGVNSGHLAEYIPELGKVDTSLFGISITTPDGATVSVGDAEVPFTIQSISKPFVFGLALETHGLTRVRACVGVEPTGEPFHSIIRLNRKSKKPSNPLVNPGAIAMTSLVKASDTECGQKRIEMMLKNYIGHDVEIDEAVYLSEKATGHRNLAIAHLMHHFDMIDADLEGAVDLYFKQCSYKVCSTDLSLMGAALANSGVNPVTKKRVIQERYVKHILTLMFTCGLYNFAGEWAFTVGVPAKSGVSGGIVAVVPGRMGIGIYSPLINHQGNSVRALRAFKDLEKELRLHIFEKTR